ncbi:hypothetical protein [Burkholderia stagnalis]|uniref:hypothetical protein n=1 Tax=Burkholderia stagnalis TaxID=1503054 RepID=UPI000AF5240C|nr:hypothetical protein [Burkholderia stagnalis]
MRHELLSGPIASGSRGMGKAPAASTLVTSAGFPHTIATCVGGAVLAVSVATIAPATDIDLHPATGAKVKAARGLRHWRFLENAKDEESIKVDEPREQCDTDRSHGTPACR